MRALPRGEGGCVGHWRCQAVRMAGIGALAAFHPLRALTVPEV